MRPPVETGLDSIRKLLVVPLAGPEDASTRATSKLIHHLHNTNRFEVLELRDSGEIARALHTRSGARLDSRGSDSVRGRSARFGGSSRMGVPSGGGLLNLFGSSGGGNLLTTVLFGGGRNGDPSMDNREELGFVASSAALTLKDSILRGAIEQGADAILIGEVINYKIEDVDPRFHLLPRDSGGVMGMAGNVALLPLGIAINVGEWTLNKVGRLWGRVLPAMERTAQVQIACRVIDLRNNAVRMSREPYHIEVARAEKLEKLPREELVLDQAMEKCVRELVGGMARHPETMPMELIATDDLQHGINHARQGRIHMARLEFEWRGWNSSVYCTTSRLTMVLATTSA